MVFFDKRQYFAPLRIINSPNGQTMKYKSLLTTLLLILSLGTYTVINTSYSSGFPSYQSGCSCHNPSPNAATTVTISGLPTFYNLNTAYPITVTVANATMNGAGFQIRTNIGSFSSPGPNVVINTPATSAGHNSKKNGTGSVSFSLVWNSPSIGGTAASLDAVGNAARPGGYLQAQWNTTSSSNIALPIDQIWLTAKQLNNQIVLQFKTATENGVDYYSLQRSTDAEKFEELATIQADGSKNYQLTEKNLSNVEKYYYRIQEIRSDNSMHFSNVVAVNFNSTRKLSIYPTIVQDGQLNIKGLDFSKQNNLIIYNTLGNIVSQHVVNQTSVDISKTVAGNYIIAVLENGQLIKSEPIIIR